MAFRGEVKHQIRPVASRAAERAKRLEALRARARVEGRTADLFPTATPVGDDQPGVEGEIISPSNRLDVLAAEIRTHVGIADRLEGQVADNRLIAARKLAEARQICAERRINFHSWCEKLLPNMHWASIKQLAHIGASPEPEQALDAMREYSRVRNIEYRRRLKEKAELADKILRGEVGPFAPVGGVEGLANLPAPTPRNHGRQRTATAIPAYVQGQVAATAQALRMDVPARVEQEITVEKLLALFDKLDDEDKREFLLMAVDRIGMTLKEAEPLDV